LPGKSECFRASHGQATLVGDVVVKVDPKYYRPTEVDTLLGDPTKAKEKLGWTPKFSARDLCKEMMTEDLKKSK